MRELNKVVRDIAEGVKPGRGRVIIYQDEPPEDGPPGIYLPAIDDIGGGPDNEEAATDGTSLAQA